MGEGHQNNVTFWDNPKGVPVQVSGQSSWQLTRYININENFTYLSPAEILKFESNHQILISP